MFVTKRLPEIQFKIAWSHYRVGDRIRPPGMLRSFLINHGFARLVEEEDPKPKPKRGRPRKRK